MKNDDWMQETTQRHAWRPVGWTSWVETSGVERYEKRRLDAGDQSTFISAIQILANKFCPFAVVPALQSIWYEKY